MLSRLHRVHEIHNLSCTSTWQYCPGVVNPADLRSGGLDAKELASNEVWWNGAQFLRQPLSEWPSEDQTIECNEDAKNEEVKAPPKIMHVLLNHDLTQATARIDKVMTIERYSSFKRLLRVTVIVLRFIKLLKSMISRELQENHNGVKNLNTAEVLWICYSNIMFSQRNIVTERCQRGHHWLQGFSIKNYPVWSVLG